MTRTRKRLSLIALLVVALPAAIVQAQSSGNSRMSVTVTFGGGMNTAPPVGPSPPANHHVLPNVIEIKAGGAVTAEARGIFVSVRPGRMEELMRMRDAWEREHHGAKGPGPSNGQEPRG